MDPVKDYIAQMQQVLGDLPVERINEVIMLLQQARGEGRQIFIMGNGGSASTASHFVADLAKNTRHAGQPDFKVMGLTDNMALLSAYANDEGYENAFARQLANFLRPGDIVIGISTSGNSSNVIQAIDLANQAGAVTVGFTGFNGGMLGTLVDYHLHVPSQVIELVEDVHLMFEHIIVKSLRDQALRDQAEALGQGRRLLSAGDGRQPGQRRNGRHPLSPELLFSIRRQLDHSLDPHDYLGRTLQVSLECVGGVSGTIMVLDERGGVVDAALAYGDQVEYPRARQLIETVRRGLAGWVVKNRQAALVADTFNDPRWLPRRYDREINRSRSAVSVPLLVGDRVGGVLTLAEEQAGQFEQEHLVLLAAIAVIASFPIQEANGNGHPGGERQPASPPYRAG